MKKLITIFAIATCMSAFSQTAKDYLQSGMDKQNKQELEAAISDYTRAISADKGLRDAYFNRGTCEFALKDFKSAIKDFNKTIELDPQFTRAYYNRAAIYSNQDKYKEALADLDKAIELDPTFTKSYTLRGQIRAQNGNTNGACEDFNKSKEAGDQKADKFIKQFCGGVQQAVEYLMLDWPDSEGWKVGDDQEDTKQHVIDLIHKNETIDKWTELGNMTSIKGVTGVPMDKAMELMYDQAKKANPKAKLTFIEKDEKAEYPWVIFTIEAASTKNDKTLESQLWYIVQGKQALYTNFRALKQATLPANLKEKWTRFFKTGKVVTK